MVSFRIFYQDIYSKCLLANIFIIIVIMIYGMEAANDCIPKNYGVDKVVCVCNATHCDDPEPLERLLKSGHYVQYISTQAGKRLTPTTIPVTKSVPASNNNVWQINKSVEYQEMHGFGGAVTDSVGINLGTLKKVTRQSLLQQYYGRKGIGYTFLRVPMGGTDFSTRFYTYNDGTTDLTLSRFSLATEDFKYKIPYVKYIKELSEIKIITAPWSPPLWMMEKRNDTEGYTRLKDNYYQLLAEYIVNFLQAYKKEGIEMWGISPQNEPGDGYNVYFGINSCGYSPQEQKKFIIKNLGPTLKKHGFGEINIMNHEDQRTDVPEWPKFILEDPEASTYVNGTGVHWYFDDLYPASRLVELHDSFPDKFILYTEASFIPNANETAVMFGDWGRAEKLSNDMISVFNNWVTGWIDWNLALDTVGGPTYLKNYLDSPIIVNATADEFYKQPIFYVMAHFSKFVPPGSKHIQLKSTDNGVENVAFLRPDDIIAVVLLNRNNDDKEVVLQAEDGTYMSVSVPAHSLQTILYKETNK